MAFKFVALLALVSVANAGYLHQAPIAYAAAPAATVLHSAPVAYAAAPAAVVKAAPVTVAQPVLAKAVEEYDPHPQYKFGYDVQDSISGDSKSQVESRDGDVVQGEYSLIDADGYKRTVKYTADPINGFNAVVNREPLVKAAVAAPVAYATAPIVKTTYAAPAPLAYATSPLVKTAYAAPAPLAYAAAPVGYSAPALLKTAAPLAYNAHTLVKTAAPLAYAGPAVVKTAYAAPALAYAH